MVTGMIYRVNFAEPPVCIVQTGKEARGLSGSQYHDVLAPAAKRDMLLPTARNVGRKQVMPVTPAPKRAALVPSMAIRGDDSLILGRCPWLKCGTAISESIGPNNRA